MVFILNFPWTCYSLENESTGSAAISASCRVKEGSRLKTINLTCYTSKATLIAQNLWSHLFYKNNIDSRIHHLNRAHDFVESVMSILMCFPV